MNLPRPISQESANVSVNKTLINLLHQHRAKNIVGKKKEERRDTTRCQWRNTSGKVATRSIALMQQYGWTIEWREQQWRRRWWYYLENLQDTLDAIRKVNAIALLHECSPVNLLYIFRTLFPWNTSELLLLNKAD